VQRAHGADALAKLVEEAGFEVAGFGHIPAT
jgi:adenine/guanine phosphoribosyltransferase-like PRPP-binding protein